MTMTRHSQHRRLHDVRRFDPNEKLLAVEIGAIRELCEDMLAITAIERDRCARIVKHLGTFNGSVNAIGEAMTAPKDDFKGAVAGLRADIKEAVAKARSVRGRGSLSLNAFGRAVGQLDQVYDEVDAATAEINGALLGEGENGGPKVGDDLKNSGASSPGSQSSTGVITTAPTAEDNLALARRMAETAQGATKDGAKQIATESRQ